jgi:hypothetical protein
MTKEEIIDETVAYYSEDISRRSKELGVCAYNGTHGLQTTHCAIGRCMQQHYKDQGVKLKNNYECDIDCFLTDLGLNNIDLILEEKYHGHDLQFWIQLQRLHDLDCNWTDSGLTLMGKDKVKEIKQIFGIIDKF